MLEGIVRESTGKRSVKSLRQDGYLIANIYGKGLENINAAFKMNDYIRTLRNKTTLAFPISVDGKEMNVVVQAYESHPVTDKLLHVDLMVAQPGVVTHYMMPIQTEGSPVGLKNKGMLYVAKKRLRVKGAIEQIPNVLTVDVSPLDLGDSILVRDLPKNEGYTITDSERVSVLSIIKAK